MKHLTWRQKLEKGCKFRLNHSEIILDEELFPKRSGSDQTRAYAIQGQTERVALIAQNCMALPLRDLRMRKENHLGITPALFLDISSDGRIAVVERLNALNTIEWTSTDDHLSPNDEATVDVLGKLIQGFIKQNFIPSNFSPTWLMYNQQLQLKFLKPSAKQPFDFNAMEDFVLECAAGNSIIFRELMKKSGLITHAAAKFYRSIVSNTLNAEATAADDLAGIYRISDPKVVDRAAILAGQINALKEKLKLEFRPLHPKLLPKQLNDKINQTIYTKYLANKTAGTLWPASPPS